ncbi:recombinase [Thermoactinomyces sp. DSM 45892]|uniref:recombinase n=1 Tax=Thermoactinomyces sp. DSM 45892 TaxID=1882753 RepID=UPI00089C7CC3|nr:recombinase [Thermoactinomyces sp. DSM 45892]SDY51109.1 hypothetical protein SAMN05444416_105124 [Thermoactinomyces sp. DSM 45892]
MDWIKSLVFDLILQLRYMAEDERKRIRERQEEEIQVALQNGVKFGRKKFEIDNQFRWVYHAWKQGNVPFVQVRIARPTDQLEKVVSFYTEGLGLDKIGGFQDHDGYDGGICEYL